MNIWKILGIKKTKDKNEIKNAYRTMLVKVNPEDDPEGFMQLRSAFEEAIKDADKKEEVIEDQVLAKLTEIYNDFSKRINVDEWMNLLQSDEFISLETSEESKIKLMNFLMNNNFVPQKVYKLIVDTYDVNENKDELAEEVPERFIEHMIINSKYKDSINFYLFDIDSIEESDENVDDYIDDFYYLYDAASARNVEKEKEYLEKLSKSSIKHPYYEAEIINCRVHELGAAEGGLIGNIENYRSELQELYEASKALVEKYGNDIFLNNLCGSICGFLDKNEEAKEFYSNSLKIIENDYVSMGKLADVLINLHEYERARDLFMEMMDLNAHDYNARVGMMKANQGLIDQYLETLSGDEEYDEDAIKLALAWCYYRNMQSEDALDTLLSFEPRFEKQCEYYNILGRTYMFLENYEKAIETYDNWGKAMESIPDDCQDEELKKQKNREYFRRYFIANCYMRMEDYESARKHLEIAVSGEYKELQYALELMCALEYQTKNYDEVIKTCKRLSKINENSYDGHWYAAKSFYDTQQYGRCIDECERLIWIYPYYATPYVLEIKIYLEVENYDGVKQMINRFKSTGAESDQIESYVASTLIYDDELEEAKEVLEGIIARREEEEKSDVEDYGSVYKKLSYCLENLGEVDEAKKCLIDYLGKDEFDIVVASRLITLYQRYCDFSEGIEFCDRALSKELSDYYRKNIMWAKAEMFSCVRDFDRAKEIYLNMMDEFGYSDYHIIEYANLFVRENKLDEAASFLEQCISEKIETQFKQPCFGNLCCFYGNENRLDEAYNCYQRGIENEVDDYLMYYTMGDVLFEHERYQEAKDILIKGLSYDEENSSSISIMLLDVINAMDDVNKPEYAKYISLAKDWLEYHDNKLKEAQFYRIMGEYEKALGIIQNVIEGPRKDFEGYEENHEAWFGKGNVYMAMKEYEKAYECYKKALEIFGHRQIYIDFMNKAKAMI